MKRIIQLILITCLVLFQWACAVNPVTGKNELSLISESQELAIGAEQYVPAQQIQGGQYDIDPELTRYVTTVGQRLAAVSDRDLPYEFVVLNNSVPNAWALPGGKIAVNRGLLLELNNEAELAAVMAHEIVHAAARHGAQTVNRNILMQGVLLATALSSSDSEYSNYIMGAAALGAQLVTHKYGRNAELEADYFGMQYMARAGYSPDAAVSLQKTFVRLSEDKKMNWLEGMFASHPPSQERVNRNLETAAQLALDGEYGEDRFIEKTAYLRSKQPAYVSFDHARNNIADNEFQMAHAALDQAIRLEPKEAQFYALNGDLYQARKMYHEAQQQYDKAVQRDAGWYQIYLGRGLNYARQKMYEPARADLEKSNSLVPTAVAMNELGKIALESGHRSDAKDYFQAASAAAGQVGQEAALAFVILDIPDNPERYVAADLFLTEDNGIQIQLTNRAPASLGGVTVVLVRNHSAGFSRTIPKIAASRSTLLNSGVKVSTAGELSEYSAVIRSAHVLQQ